MLGPRDAERVHRCLTTAGVMVFPTDTVYGVGCDPDSAAAVERLYRLKGRPPTQPAAVMFFALDAAIGALPELAERERKAIAALLPGPVTILLPNRKHRFPLACGPQGLDVLGLRVPKLAGPLEALRGMRLPILQSSANLSGEPEARRLEDVQESLRAGADLRIDGGELPGVASTVLDLCAFEREGEWRVIREGAMAGADVERVLANC